MSVAALSKLATTAVTVGTTATVLPTSAQSGRSAITIHNNGANTVYIGGSDVTTATGLPLAVNEKFTMEVISGSVVYGIVASGTEEVRVLEGK